MLLASGGAWDIETTVGSGKYGEVCDWYRGVVSDCHMSQVRPSYADVTLAFLLLCLNLAIVCCLPTRGTILGMSS